MWTSGGASKRDATTATEGVALKEGTANVTARGDRPEASSGLGGAPQHGGGSSAPAKGRRVHVPGALDGPLTATHVEGSSRVRPAVHELLLLRVGEVLVVRRRRLLHARVRHRVRHVHDGGRGRLLRPV